MVLSLSLNHLHMSQLSVTGKFTFLVYLFKNLLFVLEILKSPVSTASTYVSWQPGKKIVDPLYFKCMSKEDFKILASIKQNVICTRPGRNAEQ